MKNNLFKQLTKRPLSFVCLILLGIFYFLAIFAPFIAPYESSTLCLDKTYHPPTNLLWEEGGLHVQVYEVTDKAASQYTPIKGKTRPIKFFTDGPAYHLFGLIPSTIHLFGIESSDPMDRIFLLGSDGTGRDVFSRLLYGAQISLSIGFIGISITFTMGFLVGALSGYFGGKFDFAAMRFVELLMAIPGLYLLLALRSALADYFEPSNMFIVIVVILSFIGWSSASRVIRGMSLSLRKRAFVLAAESMGQSTFKILYRHILPNLLSYLVVAATLSIPGYILGEAALSFLGLGIQEPGASWGLMLRQAQEMRVFMLNFWWMFAPGAALFLTVIAFNVIGDRLRDWVDPKMGSV